jgi:DNA-directed RNA polymerase specialized sigma24 family protein
MLIASDGFEDAGERTDPLERLLTRMQAGDRDAAAEFMMKFGDRIQRRVRGKLNQSMRRIFDSLEIVSTLGRRLDMYVMSGGFQAASQDQFWSLVFQMADHALIDKARLCQRLANMEGEDSEFARQLAQRISSSGSESTAVEFEIEHCQRVLKDVSDQRLLAMWLAGESHAQMAQALGISLSAVRKRWQHIKHALREHFEHRG